MDINRIRNQIKAHFKNKDEEYWKNRKKKHNKLYDKYYQSRAWQTLRNEYYYEHPCCECCEAEGIVTAGDHIHHKKRFSAGITEEAKWRLLLNKNNLMTLCSSCHNLFHKIMRERGLDEISIEEVLIYKKEQDKINLLINTQVC